MATTPTVQPDHSHPILPHAREMRVYSHSTLFYWWPVWAVGFLMAMLTFLDGDRMLLVPSRTEISPIKRDGTPAGKKEYIIALDAGRDLPAFVDVKPDDPNS